MIVNAMDHTHFDSSVLRPLPAPLCEEPPSLTARTLEGLESILAAELESFGATIKRAGRRTIEFSGSTETLYRSVLESRTAIRILEPLGRFRVDSSEALYRAMQEVDWTEQLKSSDTLRVDSVIHDTFLNHSLYSSQVVKDAIVDQLRTPSGKRPNVQLRGATLRVALHLVGSTATVYRDAAGRSLHQRGWRMGEVEAPLSEVLAAGILAITGWTPEESLLDPMCGSGTFVIEAATIAARIAPGLFRARRKAHGFQRFRDCDRTLLEKILKDLESRFKVPTCRLMASDLDPLAVQAAKACASAAGVLEFISIEERHFEQVRPENSTGLVVTNPPYGERLPLPRANSMFRRIGDWLVNACGGWRAAIFTADTPASSRLGLRTNRRTTLMNGPIRCKLLEVDIRLREVIETSQNILPDTVAKEPEEWPNTSSFDQEHQTIEPSLLQELPSEQSHSETSRASKPLRSNRTVGDQIGDFRRRLFKRFKHLSKWARRQGIEAFRIYDRDIPEIPLVIDWYAGWLHAAEYERPHERTEIEHEVWLDKMIEAAAFELGVPMSQAFLKVRRRQRGGGQYERMDERQSLVTVKEGDLEFLVNLSDYVDTGLFLDHRQTRSMVRAEAKGKRFLNLFCYTGSFSVYAAAGGAKETVSVDLSNTYLEWTRTNLSKNGFKDAGSHRTIRDEARAFLEHRVRRQESPFDLVVVDAPTFSRSAKSDTPWDVERDHTELLELLAKQLAPGGVVYFSTNFRKFHLDSHRLSATYSLREITSRTIPEDFRNERIHSAWRMVVGGIQQASANDSQHPI